ncbi:gag-pol polyprotein, partial [Tanacetum coccineum]
RKALYGLKQAPRAWYDELSNFLMSKGFSKAFSDVEHAECIDTRKSTFGGIQFLGDKLVSKMSKKQYCTAISLTEAQPFREDKCLYRRENQCFIVLLSGALFQPHRRRDILSFMSITKRVFKGVEIFDQRGEIRHPGLKLSLVLRFRINCVLRRFGRQTSGLLNANCKKALNLLKKGLLVQGEAKTTSKRSVSRQTVDC